MSICHLWVFLFFFVVCVPAPHAASVIASAEGLAIISVVKAGFVITARGGSGIVIARLADRREFKAAGALLLNLRKAPCASYMSAE